MPQKVDFPPLPWQKGTQPSTQARSPIPYSSSANPSPLPSRAPARVTQLLPTTMMSTCGAGGRQQARSLCGTPTERNTGTVLLYSPHRTALCQRTGVTHTTCNQPLPWLGRAYVELHVQINWDPPLGKTGRRAGLHHIALALRGREGTRTWFEGK